MHENKNASFRQNFIQLRRNLTLASKNGRHTVQCSLNFFIKIFDFCQFQLKLRRENFRLHFDFSDPNTWITVLERSDESEPSWLEPELELKYFQLGSTRDLFPFSSKSKIGRKRAEIFIFIFFFKFMKQNHTF